MKRTGFMSRGTPMKNSGFKPETGASSGGKKPEVKRKSLKTKQRAVTTAEREMWDRLAALGCVACMKDGRFTKLVSIHHVDGRTKPGCHKLVLPLCAGHHQDGTGEDKTLVAVHPWKARFEKKYGQQLALVDYCMQLIGEKI